MAASAGKRNTGTPNYDDPPVTDEETNIIVEDGDKAGVEAVEAGDRDAENMNAQVEKNDADFNPEDPDPQTKEEEIPVEESE